jgi:hypothetical protein
VEEVLGAEAWRKRGARDILSQGDEPLRQRVGTDRTEDRFGASLSLAGLARHDELEERGLAHSNGSS